LAFSQPLHERRIVDGSFGGYIKEKFTQTLAALGMDSQQAYQLALNSYNASFIEASARARLVDRLNEVFETFE
jgi:adenosine deaminase